MHLTIWAHVLVLRTLSLLYMKGIHKLKFIISERNTWERKKRSCRKKVSSANTKNSLHHWIIFTQKERKSAFCFSGQETFRLLWTHKNYETQYTLCLLWENSRWGWRLLVGGTFYLLVTTTTVFWHKTI